VNHGGKMGGKHLANGLKPSLSYDITLSEVQRAAKNGKTCKAGPTFDRVCPQYFPVKAVQKML
jgi:hypothetical protein